MYYLQKMSVKTCEVVLYTHIIKQYRLLIAFRLMAFCNFLREKISYGKDIFMAVKKALGTIKFTTFQVPFQREWTISL